MAFLEATTCALFGQFLSIFAHTSSPISRDFSLTALQTRRQLRQWTASHSSPSSPLRKDYLEGGQWSKVI